MSMTKLNKVGWELQSRIIKWISRKQNSCIGFISKQTSLDKMHFLQKFCMLVC